MKKHFAVYERCLSCITKDGHKMTSIDIAKDLNRKSYLEELKLNLEQEINELNERLSRIK